MKLLDIIKKEAIIIGLEATDKQGVLEELTRPVSVLAKIDHRYLVRMLMDREQLGTTGIGGGIAIPHGKLKGLTSEILCVGISQKGVSFESMDGKPVRIFFLLVTPEGATELHLMLLSQVSKLLRNDIIRQRLLNAPNADAVCDIIEEFDDAAS